MIERRHRRWRRESPVKQVDQLTVRPPLRGRHINWLPRFVVAKRPCREAFVTGVLRG